jgi:hypothetical protein
MQMRSAGSVAQRAVPNVSGDTAKNAANRVAKKQPTYETIQFYLKYFFRLGTKIS